MKLKYQIKQNDLNKTINQILKEQYHISTRLLTKLIRNGHVLLNKKSCDTRNRATLGNIIEIDFGYPEDNSNIIPSHIKLNIVYEDKWMLILNKPAGISIHPSILHYNNSLSNGVRFYFDSIGLLKKIRPVNRLDLNTSGLVIFAKCEYIQECLIHQMLNQTFQKYYLCLVDGIFKDTTGKICMPIGRKKGSIIERCIDESNGQVAITNYKVLKQFENFSLVKCKLETGRTHQIRVHMSAIRSSYSSVILYMAIHLTLLIDKLFIAIKFN